MAKLAFLIVAIVALQGCHGATLPKPRLSELEQLAQEFQATMRQIQAIINLADRLTYDAREYEHRVNRMLETHSSLPIIEELGEKISKLESQSTDETKHCFSTAWTETARVRYDMDRSTEKCTSEARAVRIQIDGVVRSMEQKSTEMRQEAVDGYYKCMAHEDVECLRELLKSVGDELATFKVEVDKSEKEIHEDIEEGFLTFLSCMQTVQADTTSLTNKIFGTLNECVKEATQIQLRLNELEQVIQEFADAMKEVEKTISFISGHLSSVARDYDHQIGDILEKRPSYPIIAKLRETISALESESTEESKRCFSTAWTSTMHVTEGVKRGTDDCISKARTVGGQIVGILQSIDGKATKIQTDISTSFHKCMPKDDVECLRNVIEPLKAKLASLKVEIDDAHFEVHKNVEDGTRHLNICLQSLQKDTISMSTSIISQLEECVKDNSAPTVKSSSRGIFEKIKELMETVKYVIDLVSHLPASIKEIPDKINDIISLINISATYTELKNEVRQILGESGSNGEKCRPEAEEYLDEIINTAEVEAKACMTATENRIDEIEAEFKVLVEEAVRLLVLINLEIHDCAVQNPSDQTKYLECVEEKSGDFEQKVTELQNEVEQTVANAETEAKELLKSFDFCANEMRENTITKGQLLITQVLQCIMNS